MLRRELQLVARVEALTARGMQAVFAAIDALAELEQPDPEPDDKGELPEWLLASSVALNLGWALSPPVDQREWSHGSGRTRRIERDAERILASGDPPAAYRAWCERRSVKPRGACSGWLD